MLTILCCCLWCLLVYSAELVNAQEEAVCYGAGSIALSVILSIIISILLLILLYYLWNKHRNRQEHLILEIDPERGAKNEYAFDNPGFKDAGLSPVNKSLEKANKSDSSSKAKWNQWSPLSVLAVKSEKRKTLDDSAIDGNAVKVVALKSHDFTGLGFNICGNMKEGIYIKDVLHRGPASESGKLNPGDRINSVTISFEHMVYEDALTILSYASPYEVIIEAKGGKIILHPIGQSGQPSHPVYRSSSCTFLHDGHSVKKKLFGDDSLDSNYSSLQKTRSNMTTLERKESKSPQVNQNKLKKSTPKIQTTPEQFKTQLEQKISITDHHQPNQNDKSVLNNEIQKTENKFQKFGIRVLPSSDQISPKFNELSQNDNNLNLEKQPKGLDEVDEMKPQIKKRERKPEIQDPIKTEENFQRDSSLNNSGIKRDANGIPQEIPHFMMNAAVSARRNRRGSNDHSLDSKDDDPEKTPRKIKGKAPAPPEEKLKDDQTNFDDIQSVSDAVEETDQPKCLETNTDDQNDVEIRVKDVKDYNSDSDLEPDNQSSVNTIELNSSDITIHHAEENDDQRQNRKTASTGDLTKIQKTRKSSSGTLERAQSLDITDTGMPTLTKKRKGGRNEDVFDMQVDENLFGTAMISKEPRLSLILDGLNTFQRNRLKKSTEWGNLEDAILKLDQEDENIENTRLNLSDNSEEFDALVNKINEIKRESMDANTINVEQEPQVVKRKAKNQIWPFPVNNDDNNSNDEIDQAPIIVQKQEQFPVELEEGHQLQQNIPADKRQRKPSILQDETYVPDMEMERLIKPDKNDYLLESRLISRQIFPPSIDDDGDKNNDGDGNLDEKSIAEDDTIKTINKSDESKTKSNCMPVATYSTLVDLTRNFLFTERIACSEDDDDFHCLPKTEEDTNISDDIKVSRHSMGSLERPKSDDFKMNISNITVNSSNNVNSDDSKNVGIVESTDDSKSDNMSELYTTALDNTIKPEAKVTITTPDIIKTVTITEAMNTLNNDGVVHAPSSLTLEIPAELVEVTETQYSKLTNDNDDASVRHDDSDDKWNNSSNSSLTYITEIQVLTPNNNTTTTTNSLTNISEIEIIPTIGDTNDDNNRNLDNEFENYVKNFESTIQKFESNPTPQLITEQNSIIITEKIDAEKELHKIQEIAEEQLKKLPEMRFTTSSYESSKSPPSDKQRSSQHIEILRSNFEKSPTKSTKIDTIKSRIPISTTMKTPPTSPERRNSQNLDSGNATEILELMSTANITAHSTPFVSKIKPPTINSNNNNNINNNKNVTVTSIRNNSKIPSGLPVLNSNSSRPPIPPRRYPDDNVVQVSTNGSAESSFKQWVFNPTESAVTNIVVTETKQQHK